EPGSYVHSLVMTDVASGWTEAAPLVVRRRYGGRDARAHSCWLALRAASSRRGQWQRSRERQADRILAGSWHRAHSLPPMSQEGPSRVEQKSGAIIRKLLGYRRFEGIAAAPAITRLYGASRLFVNFFQPSFKLAAKSRDGARVSKRYHPPQTPCERLLGAD